MKIRIVVFSHLSLETWPLDAVVDDDIILEVPTGQVVL